MNVRHLKIAGKSVLAFLIISLTFALSVNVVEAQVNAVISGTTTVTEGFTPYPSVTFTGNGGVPPYTFTYNVNGGANRQAVSLGGSNVTQGNRKLIFIHHSTGGSLLADHGGWQGNSGGLGAQLADSGFYVSDICYNWSAPYNSAIGSFTDIGHWYRWFADMTIQSNGLPRRDNIMNAVYSEFGQDSYNASNYGVYSRLSADPDPTGENEIVVIKSCYPNSRILSDAVAGTHVPDIYFTDASSGTYSETNVRGLYNAILPYMMAHPEKMFVIMTAPSLPLGSTSVDEAARARNFNNWLVNDWLQNAGWVNRNVYVWDYYNILTDADNHHYVVNGTVVHHTESDSGNTTIRSYYNAGDDHPNRTASTKCAVEFTACLDVWYDMWRASLSAIESATVSVSVPTTPAGTYAYNLTNVEDATHSSQAISGQTATITVQAITDPTATLSIDNTDVCVGSANPILTFTGANGTAPYIFTYTVNGSENRTIHSTSNIATIAIPTNTVATYSYSLVSVEDAANVVSGATGFASVTIHGIPSAVISGTEAICIGGSTLLNIQFPSGEPEFTFRITGDTEDRHVLYNNYVNINVDPLATTTYHITQLSDKFCVATPSNISGEAVVTVNPLPTASISGDASVCQNGDYPQITFTGGPDVSAGYTFYFTENSGDERSVSSANNVAHYSVSTGATGNFSYDLVRVRNNSTTCEQNISMTPVNVTVRPLPTATISGATTVCRGEASPVITMTGSMGTAPYTFEYSINGTPQTPIMSNAGGVATISVPTTVAGTYTYTINSIQDNFSCPRTLSATASVVVTPDNTIVHNTSTGSANQSICLGNPITSISFETTGATGATFSGLPNGVTGVWSSNTVTISGIPTTAGTYNYTVRLVGGCGNVTATGTITVSPLPSASISASSTNVCQSTSNPTITFTGAGGTAPYTFVYSINGVRQNPVQSTGNTATVSLTTNVAGSYTYSLISVYDFNTSSCPTPVTGSSTITVHPIPTATIGRTVAAVCQGAASPYVTFTAGSEGTAPFTFYYTINNGEEQSVTITSGNTANVAVPTANAETYVYTLNRVVDGFSCVGFVGGSTTVRVNSLPTATIAASAVSACQNSGATVTFTGNNGTSPYSFVYSVDGGSPITVTATENIATIPVSNVEGVHTYRLISVMDASSTACSNTIDRTVSVTITHGNTISLASALGTDEQIACVNAPITNIVYTTMGATGAVATGLPTGVTGSWSNNQFVISGFPLESGTFNYTVVMTGGCGEGSIAGTITVNSMPSASVEASATAVCLNGAEPTITFRGSGSNRPYRFIYRIGTGAPITVTTTSTSDVATVSVPTTTAGTFEYTLISVSSAVGCTQNINRSVSVTVRPLPSGSISVSNSDICQNSSTSPTVTFSGANGTAPYTFNYSVSNGLETSNYSISTSSSSSNATVSHSTTTPGTYTYTLISVSDSYGCVHSVNSSVTVTVNPLPNASISVNQLTACVGDASPIITFTGSVGRSPYTFAYSIGGVAQTPITTIGNMATLSVPTNQLGSYTYMITSVTDANGCVYSPNVSATITINPLPTGTISGTTAVCQNSASPVLTFTGSNGTSTSYRFGYTISLDGGTPSEVQYVSTTSGNGVTLPVSTAVAGTYVYTLVSVEAGCVNTNITGQATTATVTVNPLPSATITASALGSCVGGTSPTITFTGSNGTAPYTFTYTVNGVTETITTISGNSRSIVAPTVAGTYTYTLIGVSSTTGCGNTVHQSLTVDINSVPVANAGVGGTECDFDYQLRAIPSFGVGKWTMVSGPGTATFSDVHAPNAIVTVNADGVYVFRWTEDGGYSCSDFDDVEVVFHATATTASIASSLLVACQYQARPTVTLTGANGTAPYTFRYTINNGDVMTHRSESNGVYSMNVPTDIAGRYVYTLVSVDDATSSCQRTLNDSVVIVVNETPTASISGTASVCQGDASPNITFSANGGLAPYTFTYALNNGANRTITTTSGRSVTLPVSTETAGIYEYELVSVSDANGCGGAAVGNVRVTVYAMPTATISASATTTCQDGSSIVTLRGVGGVSPYRFVYTRSDNGGAPVEYTAAPASGTDANISVPSVAGVYQYTLVSVQDASSVTCMNDAVMSSVTVTVNPYNTIALAVESALTSQTVCLNNPITPIVYNTTGATGAIVTGLPAGVTGTWANNRVTISGSPLVSGTFNYTVAMTGGCTGGSNTATGSITVGTLPSGYINGSASVCQNSSLPTITFTGTGGTAPYTFTYTVNGVDEVSVSSSAGSSSASINASTSEIGTYTYSLIRVTSSTGCTSAISNQNATVTVYPVPNAAITTSDTRICLNGSSFVTITGSNGAAPYTFEYSINGVTYTRTTSGGNSINVEVPSSVSGDYVFRLVSVRDPFTTYCPRTVFGAETSTVTVSVSQSPTATVTGNATVCQDAPSPSVMFIGSGGTAPYTFTYRINDGATQTVTSTGNSVSLPVSTSETGQYLYYLTRVEDANGCISSLDVTPVRVMVNNLPTASISTTASSVCQGSGNTSSIVFTGANGVAPYTFVYTLNGVQQTPVSSTTGNTRTINVPMNVSGTYTYTLVSVTDANTSSCPSLVSGSTTVTVNPYNTISLTSAPATRNQSVCMNSPITNIQYTITGATRVSVEGLPRGVTYTCVSNVVTISGTPIENVDAMTEYEYVVTLTDGCTGGTNNTLSGTITVYPLPIATITGSTSVCLGDDALPIVTFRGNGGTRPYHFDYTINNGAVQHAESDVSSSYASISIPTSTAGDYVVRLVGVSSSTGCDRTIIDSAIVTVNPLPTATMAASSAQACQYDENAPYITFTGTGGTAPYTFTYTINNGVRRSVSTTADETSLMISQSTTTPNTYTYNLVSVRDANGCERNINARTSITINPLPNATISSSATEVCLGGVSPVITFTGSVGIAPYSFVYAINGVRQAPVTTAGNVATIQVPTNVTGNYTYSLLSVSDAHGCDRAVSGSVDIVVNQLPTATISGTTTVCQGSSLAVLTFTGEGGNAPYTFYYTVNGSDVQYVRSPGNVATVTASTVSSGSFTYRLVGVEAGCRRDNITDQSAIVNVTPYNTITLSSTAATANQSVCVDEAIAPITYITTGATGALFNNLPEGVTGVWNNNRVTISGTPTTSGIYNYTISMTGGCTGGGNVATGTIAVNSLPTAVISGSIAICQNSESPNITFTATGGSAPYTFVYTINGGASRNVVSDGVNASAAVVVPTSASGTFVYNLIEVRGNNGCSQPVTGQTATVTVNPLPSATISRSDASVCQGSPATVTMTGSGGTAPYTFTYYRNGILNTESTVSGNSIVVDVPVINYGNYVYTLNMVTDRNMCSNAVSGTVDVVVNSLPSASISGSTAVCQDSEEPEVIFTGDYGLAPYTFYYTLNGTASSIISVGNTASIPVSTAAYGSYNFTLVGVRDANNCYNIASGNATVTVNRQPSATISINAETACQGPGSYSVIFTGTDGRAPYTFGYRVIENGGTPSDVRYETSTGNTATMNVTTTRPGSFVYELVSVYDNNSLSCPNFLTDVRDNITIIPYNTITLTSGSATLNQTICEGTPITPIVFATTGAEDVSISGLPMGLTYTFESNTVRISGTPSDNISSTQYYYFTITMIGGCTGGTNSISGSIIVNSSPSATITTPRSISVCLNDESPLVTFRGSESVAPYRFSYRINGGAVRYVYTSGNNSFVSLSVPTNIAGTYVYELVGVTSSTDCEQALSETATIVVHPIPTAAINISNDQVCLNNASAPIVTFTGANGTPAYTFVFNIDGGANRSRSSGSSNSYSMEHLTTTAGTFTYNLVRVNDVYGCEQDVNVSANVTINPLPNATISASALSVCLDAPSPIVTMTGSVGRAPYTFTYEVDGVAQSPATTTGNNTSVTLSVPTNAYATHIYRLLSVSDANGCVQNIDRTVTVTINPLPTATISGSTTICQNSDSPLVTFIGESGVTPYYTFGYTVSYNGGRPSEVRYLTSTNNIATLAVSTDVPGQYVYELVSVDAGCTNALLGQTATVVITPAPTASISVSAEYACSGGSAPIVTMRGSSGVAPYVFGYRVNGGEVQYGTSIGDIYTLEVPLVPGEYTYSLVSVTNNTTSCVSNVFDQSVTVYVYNRPNANAGRGGTECDLDFQFSAESHFGIGTWSLVSGPGTANISDVHNPTATVTVSEYGSYVFMWTEDAVVCSNSNNITVNFNRMPEADAGEGGTVYINKNDNKTFTFNGTLDYGIGRWIKTSGPGDAFFSNATSPSSTVRVSAYGSYTFTWRVTNPTSSLCFDEDAIVVVFNEMPYLDDNAAGDDQSICGLSTILSATPYVYDPAPNVNNATRSWSKVTGPGDAIFSDITNPHTDVSVTAYGIYTFRWTEINGSNGVAFDDVTVAFNESPRFNVTAETIVNACGTSTVMNVTPYAYLPAPHEHPNSSLGWKLVSGPGEAVFADVTSPRSSLTVSSFGTYVFRWVEMNGNCGDSVTININFLDVPLARAGDDALVCGTTYRLNAESPSSGYGTWSYIGPGTASFSNMSDPTAIVNIDTAGTYTFIWTVNNSICQSTDDVSVIFRNSPSLTVSSDTTICVGNSIMLMAEGDGSFLWSPAEQLNDRYSRTPIARPVESTTFSVSLTNEEGCVSTKTVTVTVQSPPEPHAGLGQTLDYVFNTSIEASPLLEGETGRWIAVGNATVEIEDSTNPITRVSNLSVGNNTFMWEVNNHICPAVSDIVVVSVNDLLVPTLITPNNDGRNDFFVLKGMETLGRVEFVVFDRNGHELYKDMNYNNDWDGKDRNGKDLPEDTYFVVIKADNGVSVSSYVVIRR